MRSTSCPGVGFVGVGGVGIGACALGVTATGVVWGTEERLCVFGAFRAFGEFRRAEPAGGAPRLLPGARVGERRNVDS